MIINKNRPGLVDFKKTDSGPNPIRKISNSILFLSARILKCFNLKLAQIYAENYPNKTE